MNARLRKAIDDACLDAGLSSAVVRELLERGPSGEDGAYVVEAAREVGLRACGGRGYLFSQIGIDDTPCPVDCKFCHFALSMHGRRAAEVDPSADSDEHLVPIERVVHYAHLFSNEGAALVSLMATAALPMHTLADYVRAVRAAIRPDCLLMVNTADWGAEAFAELARAGASAAYHALRLGEGELTRIKPEVRLRTIGHIHAAGLKLMTGIEPLWKGAPADELAERICALPDMQPFAMGACAYTPVENDSMEGRLPASKDEGRYVAAIARLVCGTRVPIGGIGGVAWVDAGCDPRKRGYGESDEQLRDDMSAARARLEASGFSCGG